MALFTDCRRWQCHQLLCTPRTAWSNSRLLLVPKRVASYYGKPQRKVLGRSSSSGVRIIGRLHRDNLPNIQSKLKSRRSVICRLSEIYSSGAVSDEGKVEDDRPQFDLDLAVLLAGFAFESYNTPAKNAGVLEIDGGDCETIYLSREFMKSIYDGQLFVKLKNGVKFPGLDLWGTSDPYVVLRIGDCCVRSRTIWATKEPVWNENLTLNVKSSAGQILQVAAWDANMVTSQRRLGNTSVSLENFCDGKQHSLELSLEGMGGGGQLFLEVQFKSFAQIEAEKNHFSVTELLGGDVLSNAYKSVFGEKGLCVGEFMGDFMSNLNSGIDLSGVANTTLDTSENTNPPAEEEGQLSQISKGVSDREHPEWPSQTNKAQKGTSNKQKDGNLMNKARTEDDDGEVEIWKYLAESFEQTLKPFGIDLSGILKDRDAWDVGEDVKNLGLESQKRAEFLYAENGLAVFDGRKAESAISSAKEPDSDPVPAGKEGLEGLIELTEGVVGTWALFNKSQGGQQSGGQEEATAGESGVAITTRKTSTENEKADTRRKEDVEIEVDQVKMTMFTTAESAMESWALLATTVGGSCHVKSDFEKICFVENDKTDTQAAIWRDLKRQRLVVAFRGTEQTKWQDVMTDISLLPAGFNPERVAGGNKLEDEPLVHSGFLKAYDSVKTRILSLVRAAIESSIEPRYDDWQIYVTGHSLGGALATLFAFDLSTSITWQVDLLHRNHDLRVTMYNYGSPRVGDRKFADNYNKIIKDSWRVVNHRDIVPTVPRLMGYCHVAQPIYLAADECRMSDLLDDGYDGDVLGESTPSVIIDKFMKGEQTLLQKLLQTEISMLRAMRDGSAVMQHMEDFYYITLLQRVESRLRVTKKIV